MNNQSFFVSVFETIRKTFNYKETANRVEFVYYRIFIYSYVVLFLSLYVFSLVKNEYTYNGLFDSTGFQILLYSIVVVFLLLNIAQVSLTIRRCRDVWGNKGIFIGILIMFIPIINEVFYLFLCFKKGK